MTLGRQPITIVEIDMPLCANVFGTAPCTAALSAAVPYKCFNTRATCADPTNYAGTDTQTLRFARNQSGLPKGQTIFPALQSISTRPAELNLSGIDPGTSALGKRARVTVTLKDFAYHDTFTDPYQSQRVDGTALDSGIGYDPKARGTFFAKMIARQPYYVGKPLRVLQGYVGDALASMDTANYVISEWKGPDAAGTVTITAKDILDLADNAKATCPAASNGKLLADITGADTTATLTPTGIGDLEYPASGRVCIGREVITFTRASDVLTFTDRAMDGTDAAEHSANDVVQLCYRRENNLVSNTIYQLLVDYAGVPSAYIDITAWNDEETDWLSGMVVTATITKPEGVAKLIGEICQLGVYVWWDEIAQEIRFRVNRPVAPGETVAPITDAANIIRGTQTIDRADDMRISALRFWHGVIDPTNSVTDGNNFAKLAIATVAEDLYGQDAFKTIYCRWFGDEGDENSAAIIAERLLNRYRDTPKQIGCALDVKDLPNISLGSLIDVTSYLITDATGATSTERMQINRREVVDDRIKIGAESFPITARFGFWMADPQADYTTATDYEKDNGAFWGTGTSDLSDGTSQFVWY